VREEIVGDKVMQRRAPVHNRLQHRHNSQPIKKAGTHEQEGALSLNRGSAGMQSILQIGVAGFWA